jgi:hypothetical protein
LIRVAVSINGVPIRLPEERWRHIRERHPEIEHQEQVLEAIMSPDLVQRGDFGALLAIRKQNNFYLVVAYREVTSSDGFVITAYLAERLRERTVLWTR